MIYSFAPKGDHLTIYKGKKKVHTPNGNIVTTKDEALAQRLVAELEEETDYTSPASVLCYHYTLCDLTAQYVREDVMEDLRVCCRENMEDDPLLTFREGDTEPDDIATRLIVNMTNAAKGMTLEQLVAVIVMYCSFDTLAMTWHIITDIIEKPEEEFEANVESFVEDLRQFCKDEEGMACPKNMAEVIKTFDYYYRIK